MAACDRNYAIYRSRLKSVNLPALPYVGLFLSDLTFVHVGNKPTRMSNIDSTRELINFDKYNKLRNIVKEFLKFQEPFKLQEIPEFQLYLHRALTHVDAGDESAQDLYNRS